MKKNSGSKKKLMASTQDLLRRQEEEEEAEEGGGGPTATMAMLAAEVAAKASARSEQIRRKVLGEVVEREVQSDGEREPSGRKKKGEGFRQVHLDTPS